jgi:hypothetical protein
MWPGCPHLALAGDLRLAIGNLDPMLAAGFRGQQAKPNCI